MFRQRRKPEFFERALRKKHTLRVRIMTTHKGNILITKHSDRLLAVLMQNNQILSAQVLKPNEYAVGNIYVGKVQSVSQNIGAAFIDLGGGYLTFLPLAEVLEARLTNRRPDGSLKVGDELLVQIARAPMKTKLAGVTTKLSLAGHYAVVFAEGKKQSPGVQVSSRLNTETQTRLRGIEALSEIAGCFRLIVRTNAGALADTQPLVEEAQDLADTLKRILDIGSSRTCYSCLYQGKPGYIHFIENACRLEYDEVITDLRDVYDALSPFCLRTGIPLRFYEDSLLPLYKLYSVEARLKELTEKKVWLKSGGYLVIEPTEALISIDVNTGKYESGRDKEETFYRINREAAEMIAVHLRARNLSGIILVDFINLKDKKRETEILAYMRELLKQDPIPARALDMTALGLMELTRKKVAPSFAEQLKNK